MSEGVRVPNEPESGPSGAFAELFRLQTEFQARLAEETLRYFRRLQGAAAPAAPGTVLVPDAETELRASAPPGGVVELRLEAENRQRVHCTVAPALTPLVDASGATWFAAADASPASALLAPGEVRTLVVDLPVPRELPLGEYRGALLLQGFRDGAVPVTVSVRSASARARSSKAKAATTRGTKSSRRTSRTRKRT
ncbi:MAG TPA: hypothetical protein VHF23_05275 [Gaiellaceae bacterium]|nr:hypothetical protein [Gaiellaceae bacterium]